MMKGKDFAAPSLTARATLITLPQEVLENIASHLHDNDKSHLAVCCKATLPILCMGHVTVITDEEAFERPLLKATRCLARQPGGISHLEVWSRSVDRSMIDSAFVAATHDLIDFSLLSNLRKLTLAGVAVSLPALQPVATCLHELMLFGSRLQGSADGFLTKGWTAPTSLKLTYTHMEDAILTAALELPVLEDMHIYWFMGHRGGKLQLHQLTGGCPQVSRLEFELGNRVRQAPEASRQSCGLLNLKRLADLHIRGCSLQANMDLDLPPSLTQLKFGGSYSGGSSSLDFFWALWEAAKCVGRGAQLHRLTCACAEAHLQPARWGASLDEQHRRLGGQLSSLKELVVLGAQHQLLSAVGALASAAPSLVRLEIVMMDSLSRMEVSPICSASLESIRVEWGHFHRPELPPPQVVLTLLPGCTRLQEVVVHCTCGLVEGATVKIRCHCCSRRCIMPQDAVSGSELAVRFVPMPQSEQGVQEYTVLSACHAAGAEQTPLWGHAVMPGIL